MMSQNIALDAMFDRVTRFEVIDETGRAYVRHGMGVQVQLQDDGRTLKVFVVERRMDDVQVRG